MQRSHVVDIYPMCASSIFTSFTISLSLSLSLLFSLHFFNVFRYVYHYKSITATTPWRGTFGAFLRHWGLGVWCPTDALRGLVPLQRTHDVPSLYWSCGRDSIRRCFLAQPGALKIGTGASVAQWISMVGYKEGRYLLVSGWWLVCVHLTYISLM